jgi:hypothetical protein
MNNCKKCLGCGSTDYNEKWTKELPPPGDGGYIIMTAGNARDEHGLLTLGTVEDFVNTHNSPGAHNEPKYYCEDCAMIKDIIE